MNPTGYALGRALQVAGLTVPPLAIAAQLADRVGLGVSLLIAGVGILIFYVGYVVQARSQ